MRIVTFNTGLLEFLIPHARERARLIAERLPALEADVVVLQEVWEEGDLEALTAAMSATHSAIPADPLPREAGEWAADGRTGLVVFSRLPVESAEVVPLHSWFVRRALVDVVVTAESGPLHVYGTHLAADIPAIEHPAPDGWAGEHMAQVEAIIARAAGLDRVVLAGDLNCGIAMPGIDAEFDTGHRRLLEAFPRSVYTDQGGARCTFCSDNPIQAFPASSLIDHVLARGIDVPAAAWRIFDEQVVIDGEEASLSDHYGLEVEFEGL